MTSQANPVHDATVTCDTDTTGQNGTNGYGSGAETNITIKVLAGHSVGGLYRLLVVRVWRLQAGRSITPAYVFQRLIRMGAFSALSPAGSWLLTVRSTTGCPNWRGPGVFCGCPAWRLTPSTSKRANKVRALDSGALDAGGIATWATDTATVKRKQFRLVKGFRSQGLTSNDRFPLRDGMFNIFKKKKKKKNYHR